jgi:cytochrome c556
MMRKAALVVLTVALTGAAHAAGPDVIATRQAGQDLMAGDYAGIRAVVAQKGDVKSLEKPALAMVNWMKVFPALFPPGSDTGHNTKALPAVWSDSAGFQKAADDFIAAADKLTDLAKAGDAAGVASQVKLVGDACSACHKNYRAR